MNFNVQVTKKIFEMQKNGVRVPSKTFAMLSDIRFVAKYENLGVEDCAKMLINIATVS